MRRWTAALCVALFAVAYGFSAHAGVLTLLGAGKAPAGGGGSPPAYAWSNAGTIPTTSTSVTTSSGANTINSGDLLLILVTMNDGSNTNHAITCPTGFTALSWSPDFDSGGNSGINAAGCWKIAGGSETGAYTVNWTTGNTLASMWSLSDWTGANASPIDATGFTRNGSTSNSTSTVTPTVTSSGSNRLFVSCSLPWKTSETFTVPSGMTLAFTVTGGASLQKQSCATLTVNSGATGTATWTLGTSAASGGVSILLQP